MAALLLLPGGAARIISLGLAFLVLALTLTAVALCALTIESSLR